MNSFWILWIGHLRGARSELAQWAVSVIFEKWPFVIKPYFLLFEARISSVFLIFLLRSIKAYLCPNMITFDAVDFSERRPEEAMFLLTLSVANNSPSLDCYLSHGLYMGISSVEIQKGTKQPNNVPLRTRMVPSMYEVWRQRTLLVLNRTSLNNISALLVLNGTSLNSITVLLALSRRFIIFCCVLHI